jgi:hypothetical protein
MEASGESGQCQAVDTGRGQRQHRPRTRLEVLQRAQRRGKSWRLARPGRARRMRPPGGGSLGWVRGRGGATWWGPAATRSGGASVWLVRVWSGAGAATVARLGQRWRLPRIWSLWFSSHTVGSLGGGAALVAVDLASAGRRGGWMVVVNPPPPPPRCRHPFCR